MNRQTKTASLLILSVTFHAPIAASSEESNGAWTSGFTVAPYGWLAGFDGTVGIDSGDVDPGGGLGLAERLDIELDGELEEIGFMIYADWRGERWMAFVDSVWANVSQAADVSIGRFLPDSDVVASIDGNVVTLAAGYRLKDWKGSTLTVFAGPRYYDVDTTVEASGGLLPQPVFSTNSLSWTDGIVGLKLGSHLGQNWVMTASADVGASSSATSWQLMVTLGYRLPWFSIVGGYRHLAVDYERDSVLLDVALTGPMLGIAMQF